MTKNFQKWHLINGTKICLYNVHPTSSLTNPTSENKAPVIGYIGKTWIASRHSFQSAGANQNPLSLLFARRIPTTLLILVKSPSHILSFSFTCHQTFAAWISNASCIDPVAIRSSSPYVNSINATEKSWSSIIILIDSVKNNSVIYNTYKISFFLFLWIYHWKWVEDVEDDAPSPKFAFL